MKKEQQEKLAVLEDTCKIFNSTNRAATPCGFCMYNVEHFPFGCAVGRLVEDEAQRKAISPGLVTEDEVFNSLSPKTQSLGIKFLGELQLLHDHEENWDEKGLTEAGKERAKWIKNLIEKELI